MLRNRLDLPAPVQPINSTCIIVIISHEIAYIEVRNRSVGTAAIVLYSYFKLKQLSVTALPPTFQAVACIALFNSSSGEPKARSKTRRVPAGK